MVRIGAQQVKSEDDISGFQRPLPGRYHVVVKHVDESFQKLDKIVIDFEVLAGTMPNQEGLELPCFIGISDQRDIAKLQRLALCVGLLKPGEPDRDIEFSDAVGRDLVIEIEDNEYVDKSGKNVKTVRIAKYGLGMWSTGNEAVADVPKGKLEGGGSGSTGAPSTPSAPTTPSQQTSASKGGGDWDDI